MCLRKPRGSATGHLQDLVPHAGRGGVEAVGLGLRERAVWHREQADETLLKSLITDHHQWTGSLRAREILDHWSESLPKFVKVFPNEYKRALAEISLKAMTALGEIRATSEADDAIAKARTAGKAPKVTAPK